VLIQFDEKQLRKATLCFIDLYNEKPINFIKALKIGKLMKLRGESPLYLYDDISRTIIVDSME